MSGRCVGQKKRSCSLRPLKNWGMIQPRIPTLDRPLIQSIKLNGSDLEIRAKEFLISSKSGLDGMISPDSVSSMSPVA